MSQRNQSSFKNEFELKSRLPSKHLRTLVCACSALFYCSYLTGFISKFVKVYIVPVVWFWTEPVFVSTVKLVFYLPDKEPRWRAPQVIFLLLIKIERKKLCEMCVHCCCVTGDGFNHPISFNRVTFNSDLVWSCFLSWTFFFFFLEFLKVNGGPEFSVF